MPTGIPIREDQEWIKFNVCFDHQSNQWAVRHECKVCEKQTMSQGVPTKEEVGNLISDLLTSPVCFTCKERFAKYSKVVNEQTRKGGSII